MARNSYHLIIIALLTLLIAPAFLTHFPLNAAAVEEPDLYSGPYLNKILYSTISNENQLVTALQNDNIDIIGTTVDPSYRTSLESSEDIEVIDTLRNGYSRMVLNTKRNPLNYTAFRRALAIAVDKNYICSDLWGGDAVPQDSVVIQQNPFSCEGLLGYNYYDDNITLANSILDDLGFDIDGVTGFRNTPNGDKFNVSITIPSESPSGMELGDYFAGIFHLLSINAQSSPLSFNEYMTQVMDNKDFDLALIGINFADFDVDWLAYEYWSAYADDAYINYPQWENSSYDSWRDQLLHSTSYEDVYEAAFEMQKVWVYECPEIICYQNIYLNAYRNDQLTGFVNDALDGITSRWTAFKTQQKMTEGGPFGGIFKWGDSVEFQSFNIMMANTRLTYNVLEMLYDSLLVQSPSGYPIPWLATDYTVETHSDNASVPSGHQRYTFNLHQNVTWSDLTPLTAEDVAYCLNYYTGDPSNPWGIALNEMSDAHAESTYQVVIEFSTESYWHLTKFGYLPILPKSTLETIAPSAWNSWNPSYSSLKTSGPYFVSAYVYDEFIELSMNPYYFRTGSLEPTTSPSGYINHNLEYDIEEGNQLDFHVSGASSMTVYPSFDGSVSESAYFIVDSVPAIPNPISTVLEIPPVEGTFYWANGSVWIDDSLEILMAIPIGNWSAYTSMWEDLFIYDISETSTTWTMSYTLSALNYTISETRIYSKTTGFLDLYLSEIYADSIKMSEFRIQSDSYVRPSTASSTTETTTVSASPTNSGNWYGSLDMMTIVVIAGSAIVAIVVVIVIIRARR